MRAFERPDPPETPADLAIVGAGAAAIALLHHLSLRCFGGERIIVIDPSPDWPASPAYARARREHFLNAPAKAMSLDAFDGDDFARWAGAGRNIYLPRPSYGLYLAQRLDQAMARLGARGVRVERRAARAVRITPEAEAWRVHLDCGPSPAARDIVLAIGANARPPIGEPGPRYAPDPWCVDYEAVSRLGEPRHVAAVVGGGLSAADALLSLAAVHWRGRIVLIAPSPLPPERSAGLTDLSAPLRALTPAAWRLLPGRARKRALARFGGVWSRLRYPMAPDTARALEALNRKGRVRRVAGRAAAAECSADGVLVRVEGREAAIEAAFVIEARGHDPSFARDPLIQALVRDGLAQPSKAGCGLAAGRTLSVAQRRFGAVRALGALLLGDRLESLSMTAIRAQADQIARALSRR